MRALIATLGSLGNVYPFLALGAKLKARGHEVVIAVPERYRDVVVSDGLQHRSLRPNMRAEHYGSSGVLEPGRGYKIDLDYFLTHLGDTFDDLSSFAKDADVLIAAPLIIPSILVAATTRIPWVAAIYSPPVSLTAALPPELKYLGLGSSPLENETRRLKHATDALALFCRARRIALSAMRVRPDLRLYLFPDWFMGARADRLQTGSAAVGFCFREGVPDQLLPAFSRLWSHGERMIVFSLGSTAVHMVGKEFYEIAATVTKRLSSKAVFLTGPQQIDLPGGVSETAEIIAVEYAPTGQLFPHASLVVNHGGIGTMAEALRAGVPQLVIPFAFDQPYNAVLACELGVAKVLAPRDYGTETLERVLAPLLYDKRYAAAARGLAGQQGYHGAETACDLIEAHVARNTKDELGFRS